MEIKDNLAGSNCKEKFFDMLIRISMKYLEFPFAYIDYDIIVKDIFEISGASFAVINIYDSKVNRFIAKAIADPSGKIKSIKNYIGFELIGCEWQLTNEELEMMRSKKLLYTKDLSEAIFQKLPCERTKIIEKILGLSDIYQIGICNNEEVLGSIILGWEKDTEVKRVEQIELFIVLLGTVLLRKKTEIQLKIREEEIQAVNKKIQAMNEELDASLEQLAATDIELRSKYDEIQNKARNLKESDNRWRFAFESSESSVWDWNIQTKEVSYSESALKLFGYGDGSKVRKENNADRVHPEDLEYVQKELDRHFRRETEVYETVHRIKCGDEKYRWVLERGKVVSWNKIGKPLRMVGLYIDYTERKKFEDLLRTQKEIMHSLIRYSPDGIVVLDKHMGILDINDKFHAMFGYTLEECKGLTIDELITWGSSIQLYCEAKDITEMACRQEKIEVESIRVKKDGSMLPVAIRGGPTIVDGDIIGYHFIYTDITERKKAEEEITFLSYHDKITGLYNRAYFEEKLRSFNELQYLPVSIMMGDVNSLKLTNDVFGHLEGDKLLIKIAEILKEVFKDKGIVARLGGDEFGVILPNTDEQKMLEFSLAIQQACKASKHESIKTSIALGWAVKFAASTDFYDVIKEAEEKMYRHKLLEDRSTRSVIIASLQKSLSERSHETEEHGKRLNRLSLKLGKRMGLNDNELDQLSLLTILHDIGKITIPDDILTKPGKLTEAEWNEMKKHPEIGYRISKSSEELFHIAEDILSHHERWDGKGYPQGLKGKDIPKLARILAIVDAYDAMTSLRVYRKTITHGEAINELKRCSDSQFDPEIVELFIEIMEENG